MVLVSDFMEAHNILMWRTSEFDKSSLTSDSFSVVVAASLKEFVAADNQFSLSGAESLAFTGGD